LAFDSSRESASKMTPAATMALRYAGTTSAAPARLRRALVAQKMNNLRTTSTLAKATAYTPRADVCTSHHEFHIVPSAPSQSEHRCRQRQVTPEREPRLRRPPFSAVSLRHGRAPLLLHYPSRYPARHTPRRTSFEPREAHVPIPSPRPHRALTGSVATRRPSSRASGRGRAACSAACRAAALAEALPRCKALDATAAQRLALLVRGRVGVGVGFGLGSGLGLASRAPRARARGR
jgi:hypothetical protein